MEPGKNVVAMARKVPPTRYPDSVAVAYYRSMNKLITELGKATLQVYDLHIQPQIKQYSADTFREDAPLDVIRLAIETIKGLSLGIFTSSTVQKIASTFVNSLNLFSTNNMQAQGRVKGIDPTQQESWLESFMKTSIAENVSYISSFRDGYFPKIESIIYQGIKNGSSAKKIRDQLVERIGMSRKRAKFIAVDQTGSILGQMTAKRHQQMGVSKFRWSTVKDERVRKTHKELNNKVFSYSDPPEVGLPGTDYRCRCVAIPVFDEEE
jgi:SPP1 gp7 family putative phage head morphogenesis protein